MQITKLKMKRKARRRNNFLFFTLKMNIPTKEKGKWQINTLKRAYDYHYRN